MAIRWGRVNWQKPPVFNTWNVFSYANVGLKDAVKIDVRWAALGVLVADAEESEF